MSEQRLYELRSGPLVMNELTVASFTGKEGISKLFSFDVDFMSDLEPSILEPLILAQPTTLTMNLGDKESPRVIQGMTCAVRHIAAPRRGKEFYRLRLVPRMWVLRKRKNSRIFQDMNVPQIVGAVLEQAGIPFKFHLHEAERHRTHKYSVQYQETDFAFVSRLLAEAGIFYYFEQPLGLLAKATGNLGPAVAGVVGEVADMIGGAAKDAADKASEGSIEKVIFCDSARGYPAMADGLLGEIGEVVGAAAGMLKDAGIGGAVTDKAADAMEMMPSPTLHYRSEPQALIAEPEVVYSLSVERALKSKSIALRDYDFQRPLIDLSAEHGTGAPTPSSLLANEDLRTLAGGAATVVSRAVSGVGNTLTSTIGALGLDEPILMDPARMQVYDHHGDYEDTDVSPAHAKSILQQMRAKARAGEGSSTCRRLSPGHRFKVEGEDVDPRESVVTTVTHRGQTPEAVGGTTDPLKIYSNDFEFVPANVPFRPKKPKRDHQQVLESAVVVGPAGEEIFTDEYGRIKVQFHWDRHGRRNEHSSCWIRVLHAWSGTAWGFQFIPRVGMEVLVSFLGGDEDRPIVVGTVYNRTHPVPFPLPQQKTQSGIRTKSTPGGDGHNELQFDDAAGRESVLLAGHRDLMLRSGHDQTHVIGHDRTTSIAHDETLTVAGQRTHSVTGNESHHVGGAQSLAVAGNHVITVDGNHTTSVGGATLESLSGRSVTNRGSEHLAVDGFHSTTVGKLGTETGLSVSVFGNLSHEVTKEIVIRSEEKIVFQVGKSTVTMEPDRITVDSPNVLVNGHETTTVLGKGPGIYLTDIAEHLADTINMFSKNGVLELDSGGARLEGAAVKLTCAPDDPPKKSLDEKKPETQKFKWTMLDPDLQPYKNKTYALTTLGFRTRGTTDGDGKIEVEIPKAANYVQLTVWPQEFPEGPRQSWAVSLGDLAGASSPTGAQVRLRNLGYYRGPDADTMTPDAILALQHFQTDHGLSPTGELDGDTISKLNSAHPT